MMKKIYPVLLTAALSLSLGILQSGYSSAKDPEIKPEEVVAKHLKSIGKPEALAATKSRVVMGTASVEFIQGGFEPRSINGQSHIVSEGHRVGIAMKFDDFRYPGEYFAFDGHDATFSNSPFFSLFNSPRGFVAQYQGLLEEGLMGGTLSVGWPLLDLEERQPKLKYNKRKIEGRHLHELTYDPKSRRGMLQLRIKLFFDFETFRHVMTEYRYSYSGTKLLFQEKFDDFRDVDGLTLPHSYAIYYSAESLGPNEFANPAASYSSPAGSGLAFMGRWTIKAEQCLHNAQIDPRLFQTH